MRRFVLLLFFLFLIPMPIQAQGVVDKKFLIINAPLIGTSIYDIESTYFALNRCENRCREGNPLMRPFIERGRPWAYAYYLSLDAGVIYYSYYLKKNGHNKLWYVAPLAVAGAHTIAGTWNIKIAFGIFTINFNRTNNR